MAASFLHQSTPERTLDLEPAEIEWQELLAAPNTHSQVTSGEASDFSNYPVASTAWRTSQEESLEPSSSSAKLSETDFSAIASESNLLRGLSVTPDNQGIRNNGEVEEMIWRLTGDYVRELQSVCCAPGCPSVHELASRLALRFAAEDAPQCSVAVKALYACGDAGQSSPLSTCSRTLCPEAMPRSDFDVLRKLGFLEPEFRGLKKTKTGRKPEELPCFLCGAVFPYKKNLVRHFQTDHGISRSQSLLYKRLKQGAERFKRLYVESSD